MSDNTRLAVLEKTTEIQEERLNSLDTSLTTLGTEFRACIEKLTDQLSAMNSTLANMKGFWAGIVFSVSLLGAGIAVLLGKFINTVWPS